MSRVARRLDARARRVLGWGMAWFVLLQLAGGWLLDYRWTAARFPSAARALDRLPEDRRPVDLLCLGSSRVEGGVNEGEVAERMQEQLGGRRSFRVLNAGLCAGDLITADYLLEECLRRGVRPRAVLVEISPETVNHFNEWFFYHVRRQLHWSEIPEHFRSICRSGQLSGLVAARLIPLCVHRSGMAESLLACVQPPHRDRRPLVQALPGGEADVLPVAPADARSRAALWHAALAKAAQGPTERQRELTAIGAGQPRRWLRMYKVGGSSTAALDHLLARCRQEGITPLLVNMPVSAAHREAYTPAIEGAYQAYIDQVTRAYGCRFVDFRDRLPDALFHDNHHLLLEGGVYFSRLLCAEVLAPLVCGAG